MEEKEIASYLHIWTLTKPNPFTFAKLSQLNQN